MSTAAESPVAEAAREYTARWRVVPVPFGGKNPGDAYGAGWQQARLGESDLPRYFNGHPMNVGVLLGEPSGGLVDVDKDCREAIALAPYMLPPTYLRFGRKGKPESHALYVCNPAPATRQFRDPRTNEMIVELRSTGAQTVFPPSTHETGEAITFHEFAEPANVPPDEMLKAVGKLAAAALLVRAGPDKGARHDFRNALAGGLARAGWRVEDIANFVGAVALVSGHSDVEDAKTAARTSVEKLKAGGEVTGWKRLAEFCGDKGRAVVNRVIAWLGAAAEDIKIPMSSSVPPTGDWQPPHLSQQENAKRLIHELAGNARFNTGRGDWQFYRDAEGRFVPDDDGAVSRYAKQVAARTWEFIANPPGEDDRKSAFKHAVDSERASGIAAMMKLAQTEPGISVAARDFDADAMLLNVANGTIDLRTGQLREHRRSDLLTKLAPVTFDPSADCPLWEQFLERIMDGNGGMIGYLSRVAGLCLTADATVQELFIPWGGGANGKSVFFDTLTGLMGDYAGTAPESLLTLRGGQSEHPTEIADLCGKRAVVASETEEGSKLRVQLVKRLTGDAMIKARFMRQDFFEFPRTHKLILVTNNKPTIRENTNAVWRRVRLIPFTVTIPPAERDPQLLVKLRAEWPGILAWCVRGCLDWQQSGMQTPEEVMVATAEYQAEQDPLAEYIAERCVMDPAGIITRAKSYEDFHQWARTAGDPAPMERNSFFDRLRRVSGVGETMRRIDGKGTRVWTGIRLANLSDDYRQASARAAEV